jgi:cell division septation protein DedD
MTTTPPFDPPYKCRIAGEGAERWVEVLADGSVVDCAAPVIIIPTAVERAAAKPQGKAVTVLKVPYAEKDEAKQLGARWDPKRKKWYVPAGVDAAPFERWLEG